MRIFCAVRHSKDPSQFYGALWSANFYPALHQLGHEIVEPDVDFLPASRFMHIAHDFTREELAARAEITQRIIDEVRVAHSERHIDLFLSYFYNSHFDPSGFDELRRLGIPTINFFCNSIYQFELVRDIAAAADFSWHAEKNARERYLDAGAKPVWVQMGADPEVYRPVETGRREQLACFVGQHYADRDRWAAALIRAQVPLALYGPGWDALNHSAAAKESQPEAYLGRMTHPAGTTGAYVEAVIQNWRDSGFIAGTLRTWRQMSYRHESRRLLRLLAPHARGLAPRVSDVFSHSEVVLNFSNVWEDGRPGSRLIPHVRLRDFEAPMCKSCYLTGCTDEIGEFYEIGKEIETYRTEEELIDKSRFYLTHPDAAEKFREAGYKRATLNHTWKQRFEELFRKVGVN
jgi:spore maturation protein CgeB